MHMRMGLPRLCLYIRYLQKSFCNVGSSMMCYTLGKANSTCLGERQLRGRIGKSLYLR